MANVPKAPGVPNLPSFSASFISLLIEDAVDLLLGQQQTEWGIYLDGEPALVADSTVSFEYKQDFPISDYPVEEGGFQSYDKVQLPSDIRMRFAAGGTVANRQDFLNSIDEVMNTTDLYDVVTPEAVYVGYNFIHRDWRRTSSNGLTLIVVDLWLQEVRETSTAAFTDTQKPGDAGRQNTGAVQPQAVPASFDERFSGVQ